MAVTDLIRNDMACSVVPCVMRQMMAIFLRKSVSLSAAAAALVNLNTNHKLHVDYRLGEKNNPHKIFTAKRGICRRRVSVCLCVCVCLSVTLRYCIKTAKRRITEITPHDSAMTLVF